MRRPDIQLLRGDAVLGVMPPHFGRLVPGGFLGVDVLLFISGFVIIMGFRSHFLRKAGARELLATFWRRRFFRLVPLLIVVLAVTLLEASLSLIPTEFGEQVEIALWSIFFSANLGIDLRACNYLDPGAQRNWMLHL